MVTRVLHLILVALTLICDSGNCATFENVSLVLVSRSPEYLRTFFSVYVRSANSLAPYVNPQSFEVIVIVEENVPVLRKNSISNMSKIEEINIVASGVRRIEPGTFHDLPKLQQLNLSGNSLVEIENGVFTNLQVRSLSLQNNQIARLGDRAFNDMNLRFLFLNHNKISTWSSKWFAGNPLKSIQMADNLVQELPAYAFKYLRRFGDRIDVINLSNNKLQRIDGQAFNGLNHLGVVNFQNNLIEVLPSNVFRSGSEINTLDVTNNKISDLTGAFTGLKINHLRLGNNSLSCLPNNFLSANQIYYLHVEDNAFTCHCVKKLLIWKEQFYVVVKSSDNKCVTSESRK
jgi:Leucine-rich repeat (LRR) protein